MYITTHPSTIYQLARKGKPGCLFCSPIEGMPIYETENFRVLLDTFPVIPGHLMISSKAHYGSAGEIPEELQEEMIALKNLLREQVSQINGNAIFYEHGRAGCCMKANPNGQKCEHFHLHCLPADLSISEKLKVKYSEISMNSFKEIRDLFLEQGNYLFFENTKEEQYFYPAEDHKVESHLLRTVICQALGISDRSDWESYPSEELFLESYAIINEKMNF